MSITAPKYPLYGDVAASIESERPEKEQVSKLREILAYCKACGINAARVYVRYRDMEEDWAREAALKAEDDLIHISREMQRVMACVTTLERMDGCRNAVVRAARSRTEAGEIVIGTLEQYQDTESPMLWQVFEAQRESVQRDSDRYTRATLSPFTEMWKECMKLIDPAEDFDIQMFLGEDPVFSMTVLATVCPISKEELRDVVKTPCNHRFNRASLAAYMNSAAGRVKCPIGACSRYLQPHEYVTDKEYEVKVQASLKRRRGQTLSVATLE